MLKLPQDATPWLHHGVTQRKLRGSFSPFPKGSINVSDDDSAEGGGVDPILLPVLDAGEDFSVYSYLAEDFPAVTTASYISELQQDSRKAEKEQFKQISPWIGLIGMLLFLGGMWVEPKL